MVCHVVESELSIVNVDKSIDLYQPQVNSSAPRGWTDVVAYVEEYTFEMVFLNFLGG